ncbi:MULTISPECIES: ABC transporter ATP-binding protein [Pseudanabaena]|uniref:Xenobiotic-transporting ATPase n=2 Tax=Pseudanabaena TaxID=1152 RepID=L8N5D6_9CYAN|nr:MULTISPECIES: ABC transporter ATP-binding protein [Pseudanabaena]ELS34324.1 Xenobiotic-transporting ATPase [Pseudanabaena biceps PCC 7429]MDG3493466.1 ABC transporter ATP-binding protein [Pseudanabaena catenata USMAC16]
MDKLFRKTLYLFSDHEKIQIGLIFLMMLIGAGLETLGVGLIPPFVALLGNPEIIGQKQILSWLYHQLGANSHQIFLLWVSMALLGIYLFKNAYLSILTYWQYYFLYKKQIALSSRLLQSYLHSPYTFHLQRNSADLVRNVTSEIPLIFSGVIVPMLILITEMMVMSCIVLLLAIAEPISSAIAAVFLGISIFWLNRTIRKQMRGQGLIRQEQSGQMVQWVNQSLGGIKETKVLGREKFFLDAFTRSTEAFGKANFFVGLATQLPNLFIDTVLIAAVLLIVIFSLIQDREIQSILPMLSLFAIAALRLMPSAKRIISTITTIRYSKDAVDVIHHDLISLDTPSTSSLVKSSPTSSHLFQKSIELKDIHYQYPNASNPSLLGISLSITKGQAIAFVGASGSGKTTLIDVLLGLLTPSQGEILVDGKNILTNLESWQQQIGYIPQSIYLSDDTIRNNIAFGLVTDEIKEEQVWDALKAAQLEELVLSLPDQLDTLVGERGIRLSGGQRQRIGIARALYHNPEVIIMDEATAALDNTTEREFMQALEAMSGHKTMIMIAHRLTTVKNCDQLYLIKDGTVADMGTYDSLLSKNKEFQVMSQ